MTIARPELLRRLARKVLIRKSVRMRNQWPIVSFTFDDFPSSAVFNGARTLEEHGLRGTFYAAGSYCDQIIDEIPQYRSADLLTLAEARHELGCHTFRHQRVSALTGHALGGEIDRNAAFIASYLPRLAMETFAYPYGDLSVLSTLKLQRRFVACRSSEFGLNEGAVNPARLRAVRLYDDVITMNQVSELIQKTNGENAWLIFYTHDVDKAPSRFGCTPKLLEYTVNVASRSGAMVLPVREGFTAICG
jgi:peptidoglycan/xylan/chitin deacetylase (PgdA/CDA1 family)